jgi:cbb3-type cytochrome oxidase maturation protein
VDLLYIAFPAALLLGALFLGLFLWASRRGQYDDLDTPSIRMLHDDDPAAPDEGAQPPAGGAGEAGKE